MNKVILIGRICSDIELRYTSNNIAVASFSLAVNRMQTNANGEREADFINIVVWRKQAENINQYMSKGSRIGVEGSIQTRTYEDNKGNKRYVTEVMASNVEFLESKKQQNTEESKKEENPFEEFGKKVEADFDTGEQTSINIDDLPFD